MAYDRPILEDYTLEQIIEQMGGMEAINKRNELFSQVIQRMNEDEAALTEQYPYKWAAVGKDGLLEVGDSLEEVVAAVESRGMKNHEYQAMFLDPDPPILIL